MNTKRIKIILSLTVLIDVIGIGVVVPSLVFHVKGLGGTDLQVTTLFAVFAICSFLSNPFLGSISDRVGRRPVLLASIFSSALGWFVFAGAGSVFMLFVGRIIDGLAAGNFSTAQSYLSDISHDEKERTANLGIIGGMFGLGFIVGPLIGGALGAISPDAPFWFTAFLATINFISAYFFLPESIKQKKITPVEFNPFLPLVRAVRTKALLPFYVVWFIFGLATSALQSIIALVFADVYHFSALVIGFIISGQGVVMAFNQMVGLKQFWLKRFKPKQLIDNILLLFVVGFALQGFSYFPVFIIGYCCLVFFQPIWRVVLTSEVVGQAPADSKGEVVGVMASVVSLGMVVGPLIAGLLSGWHHSAPFFISSILLFIGYIILQRHHKFIQIKEEREINVVG